MTGILMTQVSTPIIGQADCLLGKIMDGIYRVMDLIGIHNLGVCIILLTIVIYTLLMPLTIKQQKFSKMSAAMNPELQKVQQKYKGKNDQASMQKMQEETAAVYQKYGVSPTGSCVQLLIQLPILWSLWHVIQNIPAYVGSVKSVLDGVASQIIGISGYTNILQDFITDNKMTRVRLILDGSTATSNSVIDFLYALSPAQWEKLGDMKQFAGFSQAIDSTAAEISHMQNFLGLNIAEMPWNYIKAAFVGGSILLAVVALLIPLFSWGTQVLNLKLMPQAAQNNDDSNPMANSMKTMNMVMPLMSAFFCFTFPVGLGIYWIFSAIVRSVQQVLINRHLNKMDIEVLINENMKKIEEKRAKAGLPPQKITNQAHQNVKNINKIDKGNSGSPEAERARKVEESYKKAANAKPDSITAKANLVRSFDERNKKK